MHSLTDPTRRRFTQAVSTALEEALVLEPPLTDTGMLRVELVAQRGRVRECPFMPRAVQVDDEGQLQLQQPAKGDVALVAESDQGNRWVVCWWPA